MQDYSSVTDMKIKRTLHPSKLKGSDTFWFTDSQHLWRRGVIAKVDYGYFTQFYKKSIQVGPSVFFLVFHCILLFCSSCQLALHIVDSSSDTGLVPVSGGYYKHACCGQTVIYMVDLRGWKTSAQFIHLLDLISRHSYN